MLLRVTFLRKWHEESPDSIGQGTECKLRRESAGVLFRKNKETEYELTYFETHRDELHATGMNTHIYVCR